jgi:tetratricopeptide (TPR) repeat protein
MLGLHTSFEYDSLEEALGLLGEAAALLPARPEALYQQARGLQQLDRSLEAVGLLDRALALDPDFAPARVLRERLAGIPAGPSEGLANAEPPHRSWSAAWSAAGRFMSDERWEDAAVAYGELLSVHRERLASHTGLDLEARLGRGRALLEARDYEGALADFAAAEALWPALIEPTLFMARTWLQKRQPQRARKALETLYLQSSSPERVACEAAMIYISASHYTYDYHEALAWLDRLPETTLREARRATVLGGMPGSEQGGPRRNGANHRSRPALCPGLLQEGEASGERR